MNSLNFTLNDIPDAAVLAGKNGRVLGTNNIAKHRFKDEAALGSFAPWFENRHGWSFSEREDGSILGVFRPDADETARAKTMLFATLSHEIRTPLNGIIGMAGLLGLSELSSSQRSWLNSVEESGQHLLSLLNDILDYAKLESGKIELESIAFDPLHTVQSIAEICSPKAHEKGLEIAVAIEGNIPKKCMGDDGRLRQILLNLTSNAVKFTQNGGVLIRLSVPKLNYIRFAVEDSGIGVPKAKSEVIFDEFAQADSSHTRQYGGTGLGLAIVRKLAMAMSGQVGLLDREGGGSIFFADLPFETIESRNINQSLLNKQIGIATNSEILFGAIKTNLEQKGAEIKRINDPKSAKKCDLVLLDADFTQSEEAWLENPCISLIGQEKRDLIETYREKGAVGYLIKPLRHASLIERVELAFEKVTNIQIEANDERAIERKTHKGVRILLAEDNRINALLAKSLLERSGCDVVAVQNGEEAISALKAAPYDLVFMDVHMPVMDGLDATKILRKTHKNLPIIALTAAAMEEDRRVCIAAGMDDFITKPLEAKALENILFKWINSENLQTYVA